MHPEATSGPEGGLNASELAASLAVMDLAASAAWYRDILGFIIDRRHERDGRPIAVTIRAGQVRLLLTQDDGARGLDRVKAVGFPLQLTTAQDIDPLAAGIQSRGASWNRPRSPRPGASGSSASATRTASASPFPRRWRPEDARFRPHPPRASRPRWSNLGLTCYRCTRTLLLPINPAVHMCTPLLCIWSILWLARALLRSIRPDEKHQPTPEQGVNG
jgi:hypothetical protein